jgi:uncharacterized repeat protein (TIGR01451 family)
MQLGCTMKIKLLISSSLVISLGFLLNCWSSASSANIPLQVSPTPNVVTESRTFSPGMNYQLAPDSLNVSMERDSNDRKSPVAIDPGTIRVYQMADVGASDWDIYVEDDDGHNVVNITHSSKTNIQPRLNRGATRIIFASNRNDDQFDIFAINPDGSNFIRLTSNSKNEYYPNWSPDGTKILYTLDQGNKAEIYMMNSDGSNPIRMTNNSYFDGTPSFSPDGNKIAFTSNRSGGYRIWVMDASGNNPVQLSNQEYSENPVWSPEGSRILYDSDSNSDGGQEIWLMASNGNNQSLFIDNNGAYSTSYANGWSPNGQYFTFTTVAYLSLNDMYVSEIHYYDPITRLGGLFNYYWCANVDWQTIDTSLPTSNLNLLPGESPGPFTVSWTGSDLGVAGIKGYDIQVKDGAQGDWTTWLNLSTGTSAQYPGIGGHTYYFRIRAQDRHYNIEPWPQDAQIQTFIENHPPVSNVVTLPDYSRGIIDVSWQGNDPGNSGIKNFDVQYQDLSVGAWTDWQISKTITTTTFSGTPGHTYSFRTKATDNALNTESWPSGTGDTSTTFYSWQISGTIQDIREKPLIQANANTTPVEIDSILSDWAGRYVGYGAESGVPYSVTWGKNDYGSLPSTVFNSNVDASKKVFLPPGNNIVQSGNFEIDEFSSSDWLADGEILPVITDTDKNTGSKSAFLGAFDQFGEIENVTENPPDSQINSRGKLLLSSDDTVNLAWIENDIYESRIYYSYKLSSGDWATPTLLSNVMGGTTFDMAIDNNDTLYVVWKNFDGMVYIQKPKGSDWTSPEIASSNPGDNPRILVNSMGTILLFWQHLVPSYWYNGIYYSYKLISEPWSPQELLTIEASEPDVVIDQNDTIHLLFLKMEINPTIYYMNKPISGNWSTPTSFHQNEYGDIFQDICIDDAGTLHATWRSYNPKYNGIVYSSKQTGKSWNKPMLVAAGEVGGPSIKASGNDIAIAYYSMDSSYNIHIMYIQKITDDNWTNPIIINNDSSGNFPSLMMDSKGLANISWSNFVTKGGISYTRALLSSTSDSILKQVMTISDSIKNPTLSIIYKNFDSSNNEKTWFSLKIDNQITDTNILTTTDSSDWNHRWFDLSAWRGQNITLTFLLHEDENTIPAWVYLDEVSLGSIYPDVWLEMDSPSNAYRGDTITYSIAYGNRGSVTANNVVITSTLPSEMVNLQYSLPPISPTFPLTWNIGDLPAECGPFMITITATISDTAEYLSTLTTTAQVATLSELENLNNFSQNEIFIHGIEYYLPLILDH